MLDKLIKFNNNLNRNWTYLHKILFTFSFYLIFKIFVRAIGFDEMKPFGLIFVILGFIIFSMDSLIGAFIDFIIIFSKYSSLSKAKKTAAMLSMTFLFIMFFSTVLYYFTDYYPYISVIIFSGIFSVLIIAYFKNFIPTKRSNIIKIFVFILALIGMVYILNSFFHDNKDNINIYGMQYFILFLIFDFIKHQWRKTIKGENEKS